MTRWTALVLALSLAGSGALLGAASTAQNAPVPLFCNLDQPVIQPDGSVTASVLADAPDQAALTYRWSANAGAFLGAGGAAASQATGSTVRWTAQGAGAGAHTIALEARAPNGASGSCSLTVVVSGVERGGSQPSIVDLARAFLSRGSNEESGFGLYSYLVVPDRCAATSSGTVRDRCRVFIQEALTQIHQEKDQKAAQVALPAHLNLTYLLVTHPIPSDMAADLDKSLEDQVRWVLDNYDYPRCHKLLLLLGHTVADRGPIVISTKVPVFAQPGSPGGSPGTVPEHLYQDFTDVPVDIMPLWLGQFRNQVFQERFWEANGLDSFAWNLRKYLAIAAQGLPSVQKAVTYVGLGRSQ